MHPALEIEDVIRDIAFYCSLGSLVHLQLVSRRFYKPCKDTLMAVQTHLSALITLLPKDLIVPGPIQELQRHDGSKLEECPFPINRIVVVPRTFRIRSEGEVDFHEGGMEDNDSDSEFGDMGGPPLLVPIPAFAGNDLNQFILPDIDDGVEGMPPLEPLPPHPHFLAHVLIQPTDIVQQLLIFERDPTLDDLRRLRHYAAPLTRLHYDVKQEKSYFVLAALMAIFPEIEFFPNLSELQIGPQLPLFNLNKWHTFIHWISAPQLLLPYIRTLTIDAVYRAYHRDQSKERHHQHAWSDIGGLFKSLNDIGPMNTLQEFDLRSNVIHHRHSDRDEAYHEISYLVDEFLRNHKESLTLLKLPATPSPSTYALLQSLSNLETLELGHEERLSNDLWRVVDVRNHAAAEGTPNPNLFTLPSLRRLICRHRAISDMLAKMLMAVDLPLLEVVHLDGVDRVEDARFLPTFLRALGTHAPNLIDVTLDLSLKSVESALSKKYGPNVIRVTDDADGEPSPNWVEWAEQPPPERLVLVQDLDVIPLLDNCTRLKNLTVICPHRTHDSSVMFELSNATLKVLARRGEDPAYPLECLSLDPSQTAPSGSITLENLVPIAKSCRNLKTLEIGLGTGNTHYVYASAMYLTNMPDGVFPSNVTHINLGAPWVHATSTCAEFLRCIFPQLESIGVPSPSSAEEFNPTRGRIFAWNKVVKGVRAAAVASAAAVTGSGSRGISYGSVSASVGGAGGGAGEGKKKGRGRGSIDLRDEEAIRAKEVADVISSFNDDDEAYYYDSQEDEGGEGDADADEELDDD